MLKNPQPACRDVGSSANAVIASTAFAQGELNTLFLAPYDTPTSAL